MYVIQTGTVEIFQTKNGLDVHLNYLREGDFFGEMAVFENEVRSASVRAVGDTRILTIDKINLLIKPLASGSLKNSLVSFIIIILNCYL